MKPSILIYALTLILASALPCFAQVAAPPSTAAKDTSSGDAAKPTESKGTTVIGCLRGPDTDGKFELRSMSHRTGLEVVGPDDMKDDSGSKVKLTGSWEPIPELQGMKGIETRRFKVTEVEVLASKCSAPIEQTPLSKQKQQQQQQKKKAAATSNP
jgi:hypothetical protein